MKTFSNDTIHKESSLINQYLGNYNAAGLIAHYFAVEKLIS